MNLFPSLSQKAVQTGLIAAVLAFLVHGFDEGCSYVGLASFVLRLRAETTSYDRQEQIRSARTTDTPTTIIRRATTRQDELHQTQSRAATNTKHSREQQTENCRHHLQHCCIVDYFSEAMLLSRNVDTCETSNYVHHKASGNHNRGNTSKDDVEDGDNIEKDGDGDDESCANGHGDNQHRGQDQN